MTKQQEERLVRAFELLASNIDAIGRVLQERMIREFPPEREQVDAEVFKQGEEEVQVAGAGPGRFEKLLAEATK
jgi:hypothetical protein